MPTLVFTLAWIAYKLIWMIIIEIGNSTSKIIGLTSIPFNKLRKKLSYEADSQAKFFSGGYTSRRYCIDKHGVFNTGLLKRVYDYMLQEEIKVQTIDTRVMPKRKIDVEIKDLTFIPYKAQIEAYKMALLCRRGIISMVTGSGKSMVIALIIARLKVKTLVIVPSLQIKEQLREALASVLSDMSNVRVENIDSSALDKQIDFDCLIIDEAHHVASKTYQKLNKNAWNGIYHRYFLTATPYRNQTEETLLFEGIAGSVIYELTYQQAVKANYVVPVEAYYIEVPKQVTEAYTWSQVYSELVVNNEVRNMYIAKLLLNLEGAGISTLCLIKEIKHGENLVELTGLPFANGKDEETRSYITEFNKCEIKTLIGTEGILGEGVDSKPCEFVVIAGLGKAKSAFLQKVGRAIRTFKGKETAKVILIKDNSHKFTRQHYKEQVKILKEYYGIAVTKLDV